jgi:hypothetical protein
MADETPVTPSPPNSMAGWSFLTWLRKDKESIKQTVSIAGGLLVGYLSGLNWASAGALAAGAKMLLKLALDALDYYLTDNPS